MKSVVSYMPSRRKLPCGTCTRRPCHGTRFSAWSLLDPENDHWAGIPKPWFQLNLSGFDSQFELMLIGFQNTKCSGLGHGQRHPALNTLLGSRADNMPVTLMGRDPNCRLSGALGAGGWSRTGSHQRAPASVCSGSSPQPPGHLCTNHTVRPEWVCAG